MTNPDDRLDKCAIASGDELVREISEDENRRILAERALRLAQVPGENREDQLVQVTIFDMGNQKYGIESRFVLEILKQPNLTKLPTGNELIAGVVNFRGEVILVVDLRARLGLHPAALASRPWLLVLGEHEAEMAMVIESFDRVALIDPDLIRSSLELMPETTKPANYRWLKGVTPESLVILDPQSLLADPALQAQS
ncbi:MAG TPA: chemotaxis protein CheW [Chroococcales cyanobacterium]